MKLHENSQMRLDLSVRYASIWNWEGLLQRPEPKANQCWSNEDLGEASGEF